MINFWKYSFNSNEFMTLTFADPASFTIDFDGTSLKSRWSSTTAVFTDSSTVNGLQGDFFHIGLRPVFTEKSLNILYSLISDSVEVLPLYWIDKPSQPIYAVNVFDIIDCLDHEKSKVVHFSNGGVMDIKQHVFMENKLRNKHIFKIPETRRSRVYISNEFVRTVIDHQLSGLIFKSLV